MNISTLFEQDARLVDELLFLLTREQMSLINADIDAIEGLLDEKSMLLQSINASVQVRYQALSNDGFEPNEDGMASWIGKNAQLELMHVWQDFQNTLVQAKELNRLNGQLINKHFNRNQQFLHQLQGNTATNAVYGRNGQTTSHNFARASLSV
jgi:flagella synthesis protein FlgN